MTEERHGAVTLEGAPLTAIGRALAAGDAAPDFRATGRDMRPVTLADTGARPRLLFSVPSLDTPVCAAMARRFGEALAELPETVGVYCVSADLPFAQARFCGDADLERVVTLSDHVGMSFGDAWGVHVKESRLLSRAVFVVDPGGTVVHAEYVTEIGDHPDYDAALAALRGLLS